MGPLQVGQAQTGHQRSTLGDQNANDQAGVNTSWGAAVLRGVLAAQQPGPTPSRCSSGENRTFDGEGRVAFSGVDLQRDGALDDRHTARALCRPQTKAARRRASQALRPYNRGTGADDG